MNSEGYGFHNSLFNDSDFFVKIDLESFTDLRFGEFREFEHILPPGSFRTYEKIRMVGRNLHPSDPRTLEAGFVDEFTRAGTGRIRKIRATGKSGRLFGPPGRLHFRHAHPGERIFRLTIFQVEFRGQDQMSILSLKNGGAIRVLHILI